jgi:RNA polymerase sigma-70 factor (ECF subfamily)
MTRDHTQPESVHGSPGTDASALGGTGDQALVRRIQATPGSRDAREAASELLARYQRRVYALCYQYVREREGALDLAQEVLIRAYRKLHTFQWRTGFAAWLFTLARNRCRSELRRRRPKLEQDVDPDTIADGREDPVQGLIDRLDEERLIGILREQLDPEEQAVVWLRCFERMPIDSVTRILGIQQASGARAVLQRARRKLRGITASKLDAGRV